ncbi:DUF2442 domain-containing protein [Eubacterium limosum]|uniref:DUF2442 domain-containing protein n=1 Tax=Eubacterium limosum TaxID=1736 RepID=UPI0010640547|nr:DUF2442 domain-containing protein [Eubacterium limosum]
MNENLDKSTFFPEVLQVVPTDDLQVYVYFNDGSVHLFDVKPLIKPGTVFEPLSDTAFFKDHLTVIGKTVAWDMTGDRDPYKCLDLDPFVLIDAPEVEDPLKEELRGDLIA